MALAIRTAVDARIRVGFALCEAAANALRDDARTRQATIEWLAGRHCGWEGHYADLSSDIRDRMLRVAGDLVFEMPGADLAAAEMLGCADAWLTAVLS